MCKILKVDTKKVYNNVRTYNRYESFYGRFDWKPNFDRFARQSSGKKKRFDIKTKEVVEFLKRLNDNRKLKYDIVPKIKRKISYFYDYKNIVKNGRIVFGYRRIDMNKDFNAFPFQDNSVCKLVGFTPDYVGQVHGGIMRRSITNFKTLKQVIVKPEYAELKKIYDDELCSYREVISPGYNTGISQFKNYFSEPEMVQNVEETVKICAYSKWKWFRNQPS